MYGNLPHLISSAEQALGQLPGAESWIEGLHDGVGRLDQRIDRERPVASTEVNQQDLVTHASSGESESYPPLVSTRTVGFPSASTWSAKDSCKPGSAKLARSAPSCSIVLSIPSAKTTTSASLPSAKAAAMLPPPPASDVRPLSIDRVVCTDYTTV